MTYGISTSNSSALAHPAAEITGRVAQLARAFRARNLPVVLVNVAGGAPGRVDAKFSFTPPADFAELIPELDQQPTDLTVTKKRVGAFAGTALDDLLRQRNVTQLFFAGIATSRGVEATARAAYDQGYNVVTIADAMTDMDIAANTHSIEKTFPKLSEVTTTEEVLRTLAAT